MGTLPGLGFARREAAELPPPPRPPRYSAPAEPGTGRSAHTWGGAPVKAGLRPATDVWVGPGTGFARRGELTRSDLPLLSRTSRAVYRPNRPHTWGSGPDRASPGGERERTPLCCPRPSRTAYRPRRPSLRGSGQGLWPGPGFARRVAAERAPLCCSAPTKQCWGRSTRTRCVPVQIGLRPAGSGSAHSPRRLCIGRAAYRPKRPLV